VPDEPLVMRSMPMRAAPEAELQAMLAELSAAAQRGRAGPLFSRRVGTEAFIASFEVQPGEALADIGCGTGAVELALLELGVPFSNLWAVDTVQANLDMLPRVLEAAGQDPGDRIFQVLAANDHSGLQPSTVDRVLIINVSSFEARPKVKASDTAYTLDPDGQRSLATIRQAMRPGGRLLFYADRLPSEFLPEDAKADPEHPWPPANAASYARFPYGPDQHTLDFRLLERPLEAAGFTIVGRDILIFEGEIGWMRVIAELDG
jgi:SAM-dependent methyltransferase